LSLMWLDKATTAEIDMLQVAWVSAAVLCFLRAIEAEDDKVTRRQGDKVTEVRAFRVAVGPRGIEQVPPPIDRPEPEAAPSVILSSCHLVILSSPTFWWFAALLCVAGGILTKWTAPVFFYATAVSLLWWRGRLRLLLGRRHLVSAGVAASLVLAWVAAAVAHSGWDVFYATVSREALQRLSPGHHLAA